jgi:hypothetical protein
VRYVRRLDQRDLTSLLVSLYRKMGRDVTVAEGLVVVERQGVRTVLLPAAGGRREVSVPHDREVTAIVTTGDGGGPGGALARRLDADLRTAEDIAEMLLYAVGRETAAELCETHLGCPPAEMRPPPTVRVRAGLAALRDSAGPQVAVALLLVVVAGTVLVASVPSEPQSAGPSVGTPGDTATPAGTPADTPTPSRPPGVAADGSVDANRLAIAHYRSLRTNAFRLERNYTGPDSRRGRVTDTYTRQYRMVEVGGETHFARWRTVRCNDTATARERYFDGSALYEAHYDGTNVTTGPVPLQGNDIYPRAADTSAAVVRRYLDTPNVTARPLPGDVAGRYRVRARGQPSDVLVPTTTNYTARATVHPSGVVERLDAEFRTPNASRLTRLSVRHSLFRIEPPDVPPWYRELPNATYANVTVRADGRRAVGTPFSEQVETVTRLRANHCGERPTNDSGAGT